MPESLASSRVDARAFRVRSVVTTILLIMVSVMIVRDISRAPLGHSPAAFLRRHPAVPLEGLRGSEKSP